MSKSSDTVFYIQVGKGTKGSYRTKFAVVGNVGKATLIFDMLNVASGHKKRLVADGVKKPIIKSKA